MMQTVEDQTSDHVRYRVIVRGRLGEYFADWFDQLEVDARPGQTSLTGNFADQAQLHGLLDQLRDLGIHLISVNPVDQAAAPPRPTTGPGTSRQSRPSRRAGQRHERACKHDSISTISSRPIRMRLFDKLTSPYTQAPGGLCIVNR
jgi:hypothetical protein